MNEKAIMIALGALILAVMSLSAHFALGVSLPVALAASALAGFLGYALSPFRDKDDGGPFA